MNGLFYAIFGLITHFSCHISHITELITFYRIKAVDKQTKAIEEEKQAEKSVAELFCTTFFIVFISTDNISRKGWCIYGISISGYGNKDKNQT